MSKKRKKDGKPVQRTTTAAEHAAAAHGPEEHAAHAKQRLGKPSNPFVAQQQPKRSAQRGR